MMCRRATGRFLPYAAMAIWATAVGCPVHTSSSVHVQRPFRSGIDLVSLSVTVTDARHRHITDLSPDDFVVLEDGVPQKVTFFGKAETPLVLALLIDLSGSMASSLPVAQQAAAGLVRHLRSADVAAVVGFGSTVHTAQAFTTDRAALEAAIRRTKASGATVMYNALYIALTDINRLRSRDVGQTRRRAIVLLSDGDDTDSLVSFDEVADLALRSETTIYTIGMGTAMGASAPRLLARTVGEGRFALRHLAQQTGGRAFFPPQVRDLAGVYSEIRDELASQYLLAYHPSASGRSGKWRSIAVRVNREGLVARTRHGYNVGNGAR
jgi:Ca-activated chloride channel family protein